MPIIICTKGEWGVPLLSMWHGNGMAGRADQPEEKVDVYSHGDAEFRCSCGSIERRNVWRRIEVEGIHYKVVSCSGCGRRGMPRSVIRPHYCGACAMKDYLSNPKY